MNILRKGAALLWKAYLNHLLWFSIGVIAGSIQTLLICAALWLR